MAKIVSSNKVLGLLSLLLLKGSFGRLEASKKDTSSFEEMMERDLMLGGMHQHIPMTSRIIGGDRAEPGDYPYFVSWDGCGASLIHEDILLTAAHCASIGSNSVRVGPSNKFFSGTRRTIARERHPHPFYDPETLSNDMMILKLTSPVTDIKPVKLQNMDTDGENPLAVMGFGSTFEGGFGSFFLREVDVTQVTHAECNAKYDGEIIEETMVCAGINGGGKDSCQGDSGGPLVSKEGDVHVQVGVVSWGYGCGRPEYPGVYGRVSGALDWIEAKICELSDNKPAKCADGGSFTNQGLTNTPSPVSPSTPLQTAPGNIPSLRECTNSEETFMTDELNGYQGCGWLEDTQEFSYLCRFVDVALKCPVTCNVCDLLNV